jgi:hypothetical protein
MTDQDFFSLYAQQHESSLRLSAKIEAHEQASQELDAAASRYEVLTAELKLQQSLRNLSADRKQWPEISAVKLVRMEME